MRDESEFIEGASSPPRSRCGARPLSGTGRVESNGACAAGPAKAAAPLGTQLTERVIRALWNSGYAPFRDISVVSNDGKLVLRGSVPSYHLKQLAQTVARKISGTNEIRNELTVD